jgi:signal transduction histidine kinase
MRNLIESLLALSRGDESTGIEIGRHDLAAVAEEAARAAETAADGRVSVKYVRPEHTIEVTFDRDRVLQVASILLDNAVRYTPEGGRVLVKVEENGGGAALQISDTGIGIPEDRLPLVFERFFRTDPSRTDGGVGLGLSITRQIAEAHGGEIRVRSALGEGSTFTLHLPNRLRPDS